ncbi:MAG TPA: polysaccharide deacetylase family protein [Ottowia sp.]|nr:polysaccharide deacetylase family protein [Ottowia sp.]
MQRRNAIVTIAAGALWASARAQNESEPGAAPLYLTFDTGHMGIAALVAEVLRRQQVRASFFAANERTQEGEGSLSRHWGPWWKARAQEGHELASHTWDHVYWRADLPGREPRFRVRPSAGAFAGREFSWSAEQYCQNIEQASERLAYYSGKKPLPLFRAPGGKTSPRLLAAARACGYAHVGWSPAGFLGDELPSDKYPNRVLLERALKTIRPGDILLAHLGIWSRQDPWAPAVLEPLIEGLKARGFVFRTLRQHPQYAPWIAQQRA